jgi:hypothetical protein
MKHVIAIDRQPELQCPLIVPGRSMVDDEGFIGISVMLVRIRRR